jgi:hypothetical protein
MRRALAVCAALLAAPLASGTDAIQRELEQGLRNLGSLKYKDAIKHFERAVKYPAATRAQRSRALEGLGECYVATRRLPEAESAYSRLLSENPRADLRPGVSPKLRDFFIEVKRKRFAPDMIEFRQESQTADGGVVVHLLDPWRKVTRVVRVSRIGEGEWMRITVASSDGATYRVSAPPAQGAAVEWYVEAQASDGAAVSTVGTTLSPFVVKAKSGGAPSKQAPAQAPEVPLATASQSGKAGAGTVQGTVSTTESAAVAKNPWVVTPEPTQPQPAPEGAVAKATLSTSAESGGAGGAKWFLIALGAVVVAGAAAGGGYWLSQRPSGETLITLGQK